MRNEFSKFVKATAKAQAAEAKARTRYGIFIWTVEGIYPKSAALKIYKSEAAAEKYAEAQNVKENISQGGYVVRTVTVD